MRSVLWFSRLTVLALLALAAPAVAAPVTTGLRYSVVDVGALDPNKPNTTGMAINDSGVVVGSSVVGNVPHAWYWDGRLHDITPNGSGPAVATTINRSGTIVGWTSPGPQLFAYRSGNVTMLGAPRNVIGFGPIVLDDGGFIVATPYGDDMCDVSNTPYVIDLSMGPGRTVLSALVCSLAPGIDDRHHVLGDRFDGRGYTWGLFDARGRNFQPFQGPAATFSPTAIALDPDTDHVAGNVQIGLDLFPSIYDPSTGVLTQLPPASNALPTGIAIGINANDDVVGTACATTGQCDGGNDAFVYDPRFGTRDLNLIAPLPRGFSSYFAVAINDAGQIVVNANGPGPVGRTFVLTPVR